MSLSKNKGKNRRRQKKGKNVKSGKLKRKSGRTEERDEYSFEKIQEKNQHAILCNIRYVGKNPYLRRLYIARVFRKTIGRKNIQGI